MPSNVIRLPGLEPELGAESCLFCASKERLFAFKDRMVCERCCDEVEAVLATSGTQPRITIES